MQRGTRSSALADNGSGRFWIEMPLCTLHCRGGASRVRTSNNASAPLRSCTSADSLAEVARSLARAVCCSAATLARAASSAAWPSDISAILFLLSASSACASAKEEASRKLSRSCHRTSASAFAAMSLCTPLPESCNPGFRRLFTGRSLKWRQALPRTLKSARFSKVPTFAHLPLRPLHAASWPS